MAQGDHLRVVRGAEVDHAIDVGDRTVIRWRAGVGVERVERTAFAPDGAVEVVLHRERAFRPPLVVARAFSRFAESVYRSMFQSAEQFAAWCKSAQLPAAAEPPAAPARKAKAPAAARKPSPKPASAKLAARAAPARKATPRKVARPKKAAPRKAAARKVAPRKGAKARPARKAAKKVAKKGKRR